MRNQPLYMELRASVNLLIPFAPQRVMVLGRAFAYRERPKLSVYAGDRVHTVATMPPPPTTTSPPVTTTSPPITTSTAASGGPTTTSLESTTTVETTTSTRRTTTTTNCTLTAADCFRPADGICTFDWNYCKCLACAG